MNRIIIEIQDITTMETDAVVNAANEGLWMGGGVCGAIFHAAGADQLIKACSAIGHCDTGKAVITPGFELKAKYIIHAVGPVYKDGEHGEAQQLYSAYRSSLDLCRDNGLTSVAFPLISSGIYGYPLQGAWREALKACLDDGTEHPEKPLEIRFAVLSGYVEKAGQEILAQLCRKTIFFFEQDQQYGEFSNWYPSPFVIEGVRYCCVEQYMMAGKARMFMDMDRYAQIMRSDDPKEIKHLGLAVTPFDPVQWESAALEIVYHALKAKFSQNEGLKVRLLATGEALLAEASPFDKIWGIGLSREEASGTDPKDWPGSNRLGMLLMQVRKELAE